MPAHFAERSEAKASQVEESVRSVGTALQSFEKTASDGLAHAQQQVNSMVSSAALQIAHLSAWKPRNGNGQAATSTPEGKRLTKKQRRTLFSWSARSAIGDLSQSLSQSLSVLDVSPRRTRERAAMSFSQGTKSSSDRSRRISGASRTSLSGSTIAALNDHAMKSREDLEAALSQECNTRRQNELQIVQRYDTTTSSHSLSTKCSSRRVRWRH